MSIQISKKKLLEMMKESKEMTDSFMSNYRIMANKSLEYIKSDNFLKLLTSINQQTDEEHKTMGMIHFVRLLSLYYSKVCLINDAEVRYSLVKLGFTEKELIWLIDGKSLMNKLTAINKSNKYFVLELGLINTLDHFLTLKIYKTVIDKYRIKDRKQKIPITVKRLINLFTNTERNISNRKMKKKSDIISVWDLAYGKLKNEFKQNGITDEQTYFKQIQSRNLDKMVLPIYKEYTFNVIPDSPEKDIRLSENEKLRTMYDLFCQMMPHREWASNLSDFKKSIKGEGKDFEEYKTRTMRKFIIKA